MTEHEEAVRLADAKHIAGDVYQVTGARLAALIDEVRKNEREKCAQECENYESAAGSMTCATMLRNRLEN